MGDDNLKEALEYDYVILIPEETEMTCSVPSHYHHQC